MSETLEQFMARKASERRIAELAHQVERARARGSVKTGVQLETLEELLEVAGGH